MKKIMMTLAAVFCCTMAMMVFNACQSEEEMRSELVGTWTEKNDLFTDVLKLDEDGNFTFQSHIPLYSGTGSYILVRKRNGAAGRLTLNYLSKDSQFLVIQKLNSSTLELSDNYGNFFYFKK